MALRSLDLKLGFACNNNCLSCPQAHRRHFGDLATEKIKEFLDEGRKKGDIQVVLTGGEPTIRPDIVEIVGYAREIGYSDIQLQTNGRMLAYKDFCKKLVDAGASSFMFGIHGSSAEVHDYLTQSPGAFSQALQGVKNLVALRESLRISMISVNSVVSKASYRQAPETARLFAGLGIDQLQFAFIHCVGNALKNIELLLPTKTEVMPFIHEGLEIGLKAGMAMRVEAYPFCFLKGYEQCSSEIHAPYKEIMDAEGLRENFNQIRRGAKRKGPQCKECKFDLVCSGPWKEYVEIYGFGEFKPVPGKKIQDVLEISGQNKG
ncbi:MAG: radical SAM protein [Candidatus Diapherotrites archaeon]